MIELFDFIINPRLYWMLWYLYFLEWIN